MGKSKKRKVGREFVRERILLQIYVVTWIRAAKVAANKMPGIEVSELSASCSRRLEGIETFPRMAMITTR